MTKVTDIDSASRTDHLLFPKKEGVELLYYIFNSLLILALAAVMIIGGGDLRLTMANLILAIIGFNLVYWMLENTGESDIWKSEEEFDKRVNLKLKDTSELVERAYSGMELSRGLLEKKIENLYLSKLKNERNLSQDELRKLLKNPEEFRQVVDDDIISDFILARKKEDEGENEIVDVEENEESSTKKSKGEDYEKLISKLLKRIERWE